MIFVMNILKPRDQRIHLSEYKCKCNRSVPMCLIPCGSHDPTWMTMHSFYQLTQSPNAFYFFPTLYKMKLISLGFDFLASTKVCYSKGRVTSQKPVSNMPQTLACTGLRWQQSTASQSEAGSELGSAPRITSESSHSRSHRHGLPQVV